jgi:putative DNA primase/helicase
VPSAHIPPISGLTDTDNAKRFIARHGHQVKYCHNWSQWLIWNGKRWLPDDTGLVKRYAMLTAEAIILEAANLPDTDSNQPARQAIERFAKHSKNLSMLNAMLDLAKNFQEIAVTSKDLDSDPYLFNCQNGTIDLRTGEMRPHNSRDLLTKMSPVIYDPSAQCPRWLKFLGEVFDGDAKVVEYVQRVLGCALTGIPEKAFFVLVGEGNNGKTTLLEAFRNVMGEDYSAVVKVDALLENLYGNGGSNEAHIARLEGKRFVTASEPRQDRKFNESLMKDMTGGENKIAAKRLYQNPFEFQPQFKMFIDANHKPKVSAEEMV